MQPNVFLSYSHLDRESVNVIRQILVDNGITIKWDHEFTLGERWENQMQSNLKEADCVVIIWSNNSVKSDVVKHEFTIADWEGKQIGIALEPGIDFAALAGSPHHERYYEWDDDNRDKRIKAVVDRIKEIASASKPKVSIDQILSMVRRVDRRPQAQIVLETLQKRLDAKQPACIWLVSANRFEIAEEFVRRAANQLIPQQLKRRGVISESNDESYELELYKLDWPEGYRDVDEALRVLTEQLHTLVIGDGEPAGLGACLAATTSISPTIHLELPLDSWVATDRAVLEELMSAFGNIGFDPANPKYPTLFIAAEYDSDDDRLVARPGGGLMGRLFGNKDNIDDVFASLAQADCSSQNLPPLEKISRRHMDAWFDEVDRELKVPEEQKNFFRKKINEPYTRNNSQAEHYQVLAEPMQKALQRVFQGRKDGQT